MFSPSQSQVAADFALVLAAVAGLDVVEGRLKESAGVGLVLVEHEQVGRADGEGQELSGLRLGPHCGSDGAVSDTFGDVSPEVPFDLP